MTDLPSQALTTISIFLTLTGLLATFFYVQLSNWLRELIVLDTKWRLNKTGNTAEVLAARRECRYALPGLYNGIPKLMAGTISGFIGVIFVLALIILSSFLFANLLADLLLIAFVVFLAIYATLVGYLLKRGYGMGRQLDEEIKAALAPSQPPATRP